MHYNQFWIYPKDFIFPKKWHAESATVYIYNQIPNHMQEQTLFLTTSI